MIALCWLYTAHSIDSEIESNTIEELRSTESMDITKRSLYVFISFLKTVILHGLIGIGVVMYWRGNWYLFDTLTTDRHDNILRSGIESVIIAISVSLIVAFIWFWIPKSWLIQDDEMDKNGLNSPIIAKLFQYLLLALFGFSSVAFWRGIWLLCDHFLFPNHFQLSSIVSIGIGLLILSIFESWSSIIASPIVYVSDTDKQIYIQQFYNQAIAFRTIYDICCDEKSE